MTPSASVSAHSPLRVRSGSSAHPHRRVPTPPHRSGAGSGTRAASRRGAVRRLATPLQDLAHRSGRCRTPSLHSPPMDTLTIYHNPRCSKSRAALALLEERPPPLLVIAYLKNPPHAPEQ